jgi:hypothetical protein
VAWKGRRKIGWCGDGEVGGMDGGMRICIWGLELE